MNEQPLPSEALVNFWDRLYADQPSQPTNGTAHPALVDVAQRMSVGTALDVGCGVGVNAIWLAALGWQVTAIDVSAEALRRADLDARRASVEVRWVQSRLEDLPHGGFDLVCAQYPALFNSPVGVARDALLGAVAPTGTLLVVHHADVDAETAKSYGFDPDDYLGHDEIAHSFDDGWLVSVERDRRRPRAIGDEGPDVRDDVVLARRLR